MLNNKNGPPLFLEDRFFFIFFFWEKGRKKEKEKKKWIKGKKKEERGRKAKKIERNHTTPLRKNKSFFHSKKRKEKPLHHQNRGLLLLKYFRSSLTMDTRCYPHLVFLLYHKSTDLSIDFQNFFAFFKEKEKLLVPYRRVLPWKFFWRVKIWQNKTLLLFRWFNNTTFRHICQCFQGIFPKILSKFPKKKRKTLRVRSEDSSLESKLEEICMTIQNITLLLCNSIIAYFDKFVNSFKKNLVEKYKKQPAAKATGHF